ncbi:MAG: hypothetical protein ACLFVE_11330 [Chitinispirillaceae bacterium]
MKDWINFSKEYYNQKETGRFSESVQYLLDSVSGGKICFPLLDCHFLEFPKNSTYERRARLAKFLSEHYGGFFIVDRETRMFREMRSAISEIVHGEKIKAPSMFTRGFFRAFRTDLQLSLDIGRTPAFIKLLQKHIDEPKRLEEFLIGIEENLRVFLMNKFRDRGKLSVADLEKSRTKTKDFDIILRSLHAKLFLANQELFLNVYREFGIDSKPFLEKHCMSFGAKVPTFDIEASLTCEALKLKNRNVQLNDIYDIGSLAAAIPYCDIVVGEKFWVNICKRLGYEQKYGCTFLTDYRQLFSLRHELTPE